MQVGNHKSGRVIESTGSWYKVDSDATGVIYDCRIRGKFRLEIEDQTNPVAVGDIVDFTVGDDESGHIFFIHKRKNALKRKATHGKKRIQILAANIDQAIVIQSIKDPELKTGFIDRFTVTAFAYDIPAIIFVNKSDLANDEDNKYLKELKSLYESLKIPFLTGSTLDESSLIDFKNILLGRISVIIGPSGVGKTSLLNAIEPDADFKTADISHFSNKGKHTTTFARLIKLQNGGYFLDSPGIRGFGLVDIEKDELDQCFPDFEIHRESCRYYNCTHIHEPGCMVREATENGLINSSRYRSYLSMMND